MRRHGLIFAASLLLAALGSSWAAGPLDLKVSYTADSVIGGGERTRTGHLWRTPQALRHEWVENGQLQTIVVRLDRGLAWTLVPGTNIAIETDLDGLAIPAAALTDPQRLRQTPVGQESIDGVRTTKYRVATVAGSPSTFDGHVWTTAEGIVMKIEGTGQHQGRAGEFRISFRNVKIGRVDPGRFELPANAQTMKVKGEDAQALVEMFNRLRPRAKPAQ